MEKIPICLLLIISTLASAQDRFRFFVVQANDTIRPEQGLKNFESLTFSWQATQTQSVGEVVVTFGNNAVQLLQVRYPVPPNHNSIIIDLKQFNEIEQKYRTDPKRKGNSIIVIDPKIEDSASTHTANGVALIPFKIGG